MSKPLVSPSREKKASNLNFFIRFAGMGDDPSLGEYEKLLLEKKTTARKELVLLHPERSVPPGSTRPWLKVRVYSLAMD